MEQRTPPTRSSDFAKRAGSFFKSAKDSAQKVADDARKVADDARKKAESSKVLEAMKEKANSLMSAPAGPSGVFYSSPTRSVPPAPPRGNEAASSSTASVPWSAAEPSQYMMQRDRKVIDLCVLGFSASAARHALSKCDGNVEEAVAWLLDEVNADELLALQLSDEDQGRPQSRQEASNLSPHAPAGARQPSASPECADRPAVLTEGCEVRIAGLQSAVQLNGCRAILVKFDPKTQRWVVRMEDGSAKSLRAVNLERPPAAGAAQATPSTGVQRSEPGLAETKHESEDLRLDLLAQALAVMGDDPDPATGPRLAAMSLEELIEFVSSQGAAPCSRAPEVSPPSEETAEPPDEAQHRTMDDLREEKSEQQAAAAASAREKVFEPPDRGSVSEGVPLPSEVASIVHQDCASGSKAVIVPVESWSASNADDSDFEHSRKAADAALRSQLEAHREYAKLSAETAEAAEHQQRMHEEELRKLGSRLREEASSVAHLENEQHRYASELELREQLLLQRQSEWQSEALAEAQQIHRLEEQRARWEEVAHAAESSTATRGELDLEARSAELTEMQAEVAAASRSLEHREETAKLAAQERELKLLEEESEQQRAGQTLRDELDRLQVKRQHVLMLQAGALRMLDDNSGGKCLEVSFTDEATPKNAEAGSLNVTAENEGRDDEEASGVNDEAEEVWDLDWSALDHPQTIHSDQDLIDPSSCNDLPQEAVVQESLGAPQHADGADEPPADETDKDGCAASSMIDPAGASVENDAACVSRCSADRGEEEDVLPGSA